MNLQNRWYLNLGLIVAFTLIASFACPFADEIKPAIEILDQNMAVADPDGDWLWYDAAELTVEGKGWNDTASFYHRLPARAEKIVRSSVWSLSNHSAGMAIRFSTNAQRIGAKWKVSNTSLAMPHMPATGVSGLDIYVHNEGTWQWIGAGRPAAQETQAILASGIPEGEYEYLIYLPLYNGTDRLEIGVPPEAVLSQPPARPEGQDKPILFYGSSITQGGCAARPGMAYPSIIGRHLDYPTINLGFSGNGTMDAEIGELMAEIECAAYVIDCVPNTNAEEITERIVPFVTALRAARPDTPILLVESVHYQSGTFLPEVRKGNVTKNNELHAGYERLVENGINDLHYFFGAPLLGNDGEAAVDGVHPTDLGFLRMAECLEPALRAILAK
ncbi:MAG: hypothetical protein GX117_05365 [Candidatus Hydrogenedentes bacterium]|nr:hypothetical protein [Candidatus Hydrogenedentota bacterium]